MKKRIPSHLLLLVYSAPIFSVAAAPPLQSAPRRIEANRDALFSSLQLGLHQHVTPVIDR